MKGGNEPQHRRNLFLEWLEDEPWRDSLGLCGFKTQCLWLYHSSQGARSRLSTTVPKGGSTRRCGCGIVFSTKRRVQDVRREKQTNKKGAIFVGLWGWRGGQRRDWILAPVNLDNSFSFFQWETWTRLVIFKWVLKNRRFLQKSLRVYCNRKRRFNNRCGPQL